MSKKYIEYLKHILQECEYISGVLSDTTDKDSFSSDETLKRLLLEALK